jgi:hypothetical protein
VFQGAGIHAVGHLVGVFIVAWFFVSFIVSDSLYSHRLISTSLMALYALLSASEFVRERRGDAKRKRDN